MSFSRDSNAPLCLSSDSCRTAVGVGILYYKDSLEKRAASRRKGERRKATVERAAREKRGANENKFGKRPWPITIRAECGRLRAPIRASPDLGQMGPHTSAFQSTTMSDSPTNSTAAIPHTHGSATDATQASGTGFFPPRKLILTKEQLEAFQQSKTHETIVAYITALNEAVVGVKLTDECPVSPVRKSAGTVCVRGCAYGGLTVPGRASRA